MVKWLAHVPRPEARAAMLSLVVGVGLTTLKFVAYFLTGSTAVFSDALESIVNVAGAAFATYALVLAHTPADESHPYGHGKVEFLSAGFEGGMILLAAGAASIKAIGDLVRGPDLETRGLTIGLAIVALALVVN